MLKTPDFSKSKILIVGDVMLDRYLHGDSSRLSPEAPVPVVKFSSSINRAGGAANVALNIISLGANVGILGLVGDDEEAKILNKILEEKGVTTYFNYTKKPTVCKSRIIVNKHQLVRLDNEDMFEPDDNFYKLFEDKVQQYDLVIISDYNKGTVINSTKIIDIASKYNKRTLVDPKQLDSLSYKGATIVTPNLKEFEQWVGQCSNDVEIEEKGKKLIKSSGWEYLLVTRSEKGMTLLSSQHNIIHFPSEVKDVFDVTGAGDTVIAMLGCMMSVSQTIDQSVRFANIAAGIAVSKFGTATVSVNEINNWLSNRQKKYTDIDNLCEILDSHRKNNEKIVFTNGCFDILHFGHVTYLKEAKSLGDILVIGINTDDSINRLKGDKRPIVPLDERMDILEALESVDYIISFSQDTPKELIKQIKPDILVKGGDYSSIKELVGHDFVISYGGDVKILSHIPNASTTNIIKKILQNN